MTTVERPRRRWQFSLRQAALMIAIVGLALAVIREVVERMRPMEPLVIRLEPGALYVNQRRVIWDELPAAIHNRAASLTQCRCRLEAADEVTIGEVRRVMELIREESSLSGDDSCHIALWTGPKNRLVGPAHLSLARQPMRVCMAVHVAADAAGNPSAVSWAGLGVLGGDTVPTPTNDYQRLHADAVTCSEIDYQAEVPRRWYRPSASLWCDDALKIRHAADAVDAISIHDLPDGSLQVLAAVFIQPFDTRHLQPEKVP